MDCSLSGSSVHRIFQARVLEWVAVFFSRGSSQPRGQTQVLCIPGRRFTIRATREAPTLCGLVGVKRLHARLPFPAQLNPSLSIFMASPSQTTSLGEERNEISWGIFSYLIVTLTISYSNPAAPGPALRLETDQSGLLSRGFLCGVGHWSRISESSRQWRVPRSWQLNEARSTESQHHLLHRQSGASLQPWGQAQLPLSKPTSVATSPASARTSPPPRGSTGRGCQGPPPALCWGIRQVTEIKTQRETLSYLLELVTVQSLSLTVLQAR